MAVEAEQPIIIEKVRDEERFFGGDIVWWALLLVCSVPVVLFGLGLAPDLGGFLLMIVGGVLGGVAFAQVMLRMPYFTSGFVKSMLIVLLASVVIAGVALLYNMTLPVPTAPPDVLYKPPISGG
ncbi:MAG TPA: hypothetical protein VK898_07880 [Chloroflexota bacterium]|nr:hypothetical protein [Chloroflexota bacterium]